MTYQDHMTNDVVASVRQFINVPRSILNQRAEQEAERYVSSSRGMEDDDAKKVAKELYISAFTDLVKAEL